MRSILFGVLLFCSVSLAAKNMFVVIHVSERVIVHYICIGNKLGAGGLLQKSFVSAPGRVSWHVVDGVAPYTMIDQYLQNGAIHITVIDAAGTIASSSAMLRTRDERVFRDCTPKNYEFTEEEIVQIRQEEVRKYLAKRNSGKGDGGGLASRTLIRPERKGGGGSGGGIHSTFSSRSSAYHVKTGGSGGGGGGGSGGVIRHNSTRR